MFRVRDISSFDNPHFKSWMSLKKAKGIKKANKCLVLGQKILEELSVQKTHLFHEILYPQHLEVNHVQQSNVLLNFASKLSLPVFRLKQDLFKNLDLFETNAPIGILKVPQMDLWDENQACEGKEILLPLGNSLNLGVVIRSAKAFGISRVILLKEAAHPFLPQAIRSSSGAVFHTCFLLGTSIQELQKPLLALALKGTPLTEFVWPQKARLLIGEEGLGLPSKLSVTSISIKIAKDIDSLNVAVATGIALHDWQSKKDKKIFLNMI